MKVSNPTNDQIVEMIEYNRKDGQATTISYQGFYIWIYTNSVIEYEDEYKTINISIDNLIRIMTNKKAWVVE